MVLLAAVLAAPLAAQGADVLPGRSTQDESSADRIAEAAAAAPVDTRELVVNGGFENGTNGWRINDPKTQLLEITDQARSGRRAAVLRAVKAGTMALNDDTNTVSSTEKGTTYQVSAYLRGSKAGLSAVLRIREVQDEKLVNSEGREVRLTGQWQQVTFSYVTQTKGGHLDLNVVGWEIPKGAAIGVDDVSMRRTSNPPVPTTTKPVPTTTSTTTKPTTSSSSTSASSTSSATSSSTTKPSTSSGTTSSAPAPTTAKPTTTTSTTPSATSSTRPTGGCIAARGIPTCGPLLGAAIGGNDDPTAKEATFGAKLALRRTYYQSTQVAGAVRNAQADLATGRLPWISFKLPHSWTDMANGKGDAWAKDLATRLSQLNGPVWVAFHHEPENDGPIAEWTRMQKRLSPIVRDAAPNVAFTIVLTGWNQVFGTNPDYSFEATWPGDGLVDIVGIDPYNEYGAVKNGKMISTSVELKEYYTVLSAFAKKHRANWAVAETGYTNLQADRDPAWLNRAFADMRAMGGVGLSYFDSPLNSYADWTLSTPEKMAAFRSALQTTSRMSG